MIQANYCQENIKEITMKRYCNITCLILFPSLLASCGAYQTASVARPPLRVENSALDYSSFPDLSFLI